MQELLATMATLRGPNGCPWDQEQTHETLTTPLIEECAELLETIDQMDMPHMREELGDVLLQVVFHAQLAEEAGHFDFEDVAREINDKLIRRHPHVFGDAQAEDAAAVVKNWEEIKAEEKKNQPETHRVFKSLPPRLPALQWAAKIRKQMNKRGLDVSPWVEASSPAERNNRLTDESAGKLLFTLVSACWEQGIDPESALRRYGQQIIDHHEHATAARTSPV
ncbi:MAG: dITP/XTP pyrophosphatase [Puniceicoccaceae bacterium 5H]|nr:MAG: dITP/XTP pyrophosphatase [Puniceicoccaceae bacterium 5H]